MPTVDPSGRHPFAASGAGVVGEGLKGTDSRTDAPYTYRLELVDGSAADPPTLETTVYSLAARRPDSPGPGPRVEGGRDPAGH
jgi:hypothetical protein